MMNLSIKIKNLIRKNYCLTRLLYDYKFHKSGIDSKSIIIYQMGKVGSTSILHSLQAIDSIPAVFQVHTLSDKGINEMENRYWGNTPTIIRRSLLPETTHVYVSHSLKSRLSKNPDSKWKIITLVRDPIARNVSEFFYSVDTTKNDPHIPDFYARYRSGNINVSELIDRFLERFSEGSDEYTVPLNWFDREFPNVIGFDIYSIEFPRQKGFNIIHSDKYDILILKLEWLKTCFSKAFHEFLGLQNFDLVTKNTASQKAYYPIYKKFLQEVDLPYQYVSRIYNSKYVQHFYTAREIEKFVKRWNKN